jgi:hypothetical protein
LQICTRCVLPRNFPGISFDAAGLCSHCQRALPPDEQRRHRLALADALWRTVEERRGARPYDCIVAFSGGKDSSYTLLHLVRERGLRCLAVTIDNGFLSQQALRNCKTITEALATDFMLLAPAPSFLNRMYLESIRKNGVHAPAAVKRASNVCNSCINLVNNQVLRIAAQNQAPLIAGGYLGGQVPKDAVQMTIHLEKQASLREVSLAKYIEHFGPEAETYFRIPAGSHEVVLMNPMLVLEVPEEKIVEEISALGWKRPKDTGMNSSNCRLNDLGIALHYRQHGFNPYVLEIAEQVREGLMSREVGLAKAAAIPTFEEVADRAARLGLTIVD